MPEYLCVFLIIIIAIIIGFFLLVPQLLSDFLSFDGEMKRGLRIGTGELDLEIQHFLRNLQNSIHTEQSFIRKEGNEILIAVSNRRWRNKRDRWVYVAYIDLQSQPDRIEFRVFVGSLVSLLMVLPLIYGYILVVTGALFWPETPTYCYASLGLVIFFAALLGVILNHSREKRSLMSVLHQATKQI